MTEIRLLTADDIEVRVAQTTTGRDGVVKAAVLLYKNARVDMRILDELYGPMGWQRRHKVIDGKMYCEVSVYDEAKACWVAKEDVGVESNTEAEKGQASDSFKRACVNWGIGRELYTSPKSMWIPLGESDYSKDQSGRVKVWTRFTVLEIAYDEKTRTITHLVIGDDKGFTRYQWNKDAKPKAVTSSTSAVQARRKAAGRNGATKVEQVPAETPKASENAKNQLSPVQVTSAQYWTIIGKYCKGELAKSGKDYRTAWAEMVQADADQLAAFDNDAENYRAAHEFNTQFE